MPVFYAKMNGKRFANIAYDEANANQVRLLAGLDRRVILSPNRLYLTGITANGLPVVVDEAPQFYKDHCALLSYIRARHGFEEFVDQLGDRRYSEQIAVLLADRADLRPVWIELQVLHNIWTDLVPRSQVIEFAGQRISALKCVTWHSNDEYHKSAAAKTIKAIENYFCGGLWLTNGVFAPADICGV